MEVIRNYNVWPGKQVFKCKGWIMLGEVLNRPEYYRTGITFLMILLPVVFHLSASGENFVKDYTWIVFIEVFLMIFSLLFLCLTAMSNPGFIPRQEFPFAKVPYGAPTLIKALLKDQTKPCVIDKGSVILPYRGRTVQMKFCSSCYITRPPRCSHCGDCDVCIEKFDHHCPWIGNCIGKYNYKYFIGFLYFTSILIVFVLFGALEHSIEVIDGEGNFLDGLGKFAEEASGSIFVLVYGGFFVWFVLGMSVFHTYLIFCNMTTHEYMKKVHKEPTYNPFDLGVCLNIGEMLERRPKQFIENFRKVFEDFRNIESESISHTASKINPDYTSVNDDYKIKENFVSKDTISIVEILELNQTSEINNTE